MLTPAWSIAVAFLALQTADTRVDSVPVAADEGTELPDPSPVVQTDPSPAPEQEPVSTPTPTPSTTALPQSPLAQPVPVAAPLWVNSADDLVWLHARAELGSLAVLKHDIQFGQEGTAFDYVADGGQNNLYLFARLEGEAVIARRHIVTLVYQPIDVRTEVTLREDLRVFDTTFAAGTPLNLRYGFDFVRTTYMFDFLDDSGDELAIGAGLQLRNAVIAFSDQAGTSRVSNRNIGPVPLLSARGRVTLDDGPLAGMFAGAEVSGFWASGKFITGSTNDFEGAILDTSIRAGVPVTSFANLYVVARVIGGGARGVAADSDEPGDGFTENWLWTGSVAVGAELF